MLLETKYIFSAYFDYSDLTLFWYPFSTRPDQRILFLGHQKILKSSRSLLLHVLL